MMVERGSEILRALVNLHEVRLIRSFVPFEDKGSLR